MRSMGRQAGWAALGTCLLAIGCAPRAVKAPPAGEVAIAITESGFEPQRTVIPKGAPVTLVFTRKTDRTCATEVVFPKLGKRYPLPLDRPVRVELKAGVQDSLDYACGMNMFTGVVEAK